MYPQVTQYFKIGKVLKSHGTAGQVRLLVEDQFKNYLKKGAYVFFELQGSKVPFKVLEAEDHAHFVLTLDDVKNKKEADVLSGHEAWIPLDTVKSRHQRSPRNLKDKWDHYTIADNTSGISYTILRVEEYPQQLMAIIDYQGKEILIPLSEQLITAIDKERRLISMLIPEGLLDL